MDMGFFDKGLKGPVFLKEDSHAQRQLEQLEALHTDDAELRKKIDKDIKLLKYGIAGEKQIAFELRNSHIPMYILHDLYLEHNGLTAQLDYVLVTKGKTFILECKNLYGNIEINNAGDFVRTVQYGRKYEKEGIYSPITQNRRHLELLKAIISERQPNFLRRAMFEKYFYDEYRSVVILANPQTVLNAKFAKKEIKEQVIRSDQLIAYIKRINAGETYASAASMQEFANFLLSIHKEISIDYTEKYKKAIAESTVQKNNLGDLAIAEEKLLCPRCGAVMVKRQAKRGAYAGNVFWGCSNYPECKCIVNVESSKSM